MFVLVDADRFNWGDLSAVFHDAHDHVHYLHDEIARLRNAPPPSAARAVSPAPSMSESAAIAALAIRTEELRQATVQQQADHAGWEAEKAKTLILQKQLDGHQCTGAPDLQRERDEWRAKLQAAQDKLTAETEKVKLLQAAIDKHDEEMTQQRRTHNETLAAAMKERDTVAEKLQRVTADAEEAHRVVKKQIAEYRRLLPSGFRTDLLNDAVAGWYQHQLALGVDLSDPDWFAEHPYVGSGMSPPPATHTPPSPTQDAPHPKRAKTQTEAHQTEAEVDVDLTGSPAHTPTDSEESKGDNDDREDVGDSEGSGATGVAGDLEKAHRKPAKYDPDVRRNPPHDITDCRPRLRVLWVECLRRKFLEDILTAQVWSDAALNETRLISATSPAQGREEKERIETLGALIPRVLCPAMRFGIFPTVIPDKMKQPLQNVRYTPASIRGKMLNVSDDMASLRPWLVYEANTPDPISYDPTDVRFQPFEVQRVRVASTYRPLWYRTHFIPTIEIARAVNRDAGPGNEVFGKEEFDILRDRRDKWMRIWGHRNMVPFWKEVAGLIMHGHCDLLLLLDPAVPMYDGSESFPWIPNFADDAPSYTEQLNALDDRQPWRAMYTNRPDQHPAHRSNAISLLTGRFTTAENRHFEHGREWPLVDWSVPGENDLIPRPQTSPDPDVEEWVQPYDRTVDYQPAFPEA